MAEGRTETGMSDDLITCPICFERFKIPKSLPCLHTYCKGCLHTYITKAVSESKPKVECPTCRTSVRDFTGQDVDKWIEGLPTNFIVNSLIEREEMQTGKRNCDICLHLDKSVSATKWCNECSEAYCDGCSQSHTFHKMFRKHALIQIKDARTDMVFAKDENSFDCSVHKNRKVELFCFDHSEPCCLTCMTVHHRKCDKVTTLEEAAENFRKDPTFVSFTKRMNELTSELRNERTRHDKTEKTVALELSQVKDQAQAKKQEMIKHIKKLYTKFEGEIQVIEKQRETEDHSGILTQKIVQLELFVKTLETLESTSSDLSLFLEFHKMKGKQKDFEEFLDQFKSRKKQESVEFICHENVRKFESVVSSFGTVRVVDSLAQAQSSRSSTIDYTSCTLKQVVNIEEEGVRFTDAVCIHSGTILAVDDTKNAIWAYDDTGTLLTKSDLPSNPWALAVVDSNKVVVTLRGQKSLQFFTFHEDSKTFRKGNTIQLIETPWAIECAYNNLFVTFVQKVKKITLDGKIVNELLIPNSSFSLYDISIFNGNTIVSDCEHQATYSIHFITMDSTPLVKFQKKYSKLVFPLGVTCDRVGNVYVAGWESNNVIQLSRTGDVLREILPSSSGFKQLMGINFTHDGSKFILTHQNKITLFELQ